VREHNDQGGASAGQAARREPVEEVKIAGTDHSVNIGFQVGASSQVKDGQDCRGG
jgi:hypothetical protein